MSSQNISKLLAHFLTIAEFNDKSNPSANELWFVKMPHWLTYTNCSCLTITTQPTASGGEINFYAGASFIVHKGKNSDGTNNNEIVYIDEDTYTSVDFSGSYCFDSSGEMVTGYDISYDSSTNMVSVDGTPGYYTQKIQDFSYEYDDEQGLYRVILNGDIKPMVIGSGGGGGSVSYSGDMYCWCIDFGSFVIQGGNVYVDYESYGTSVTFLEPMSDEYYWNICLPSDYSYSQAYANYKYTTGMDVQFTDSYNSGNIAWLVIGEKA